MDKLHTLANGIVNHWPAILAALTGLASFVGSLKALFSTHPKVDGALDKTLDVLSWVSRSGAKGVPYLGRFSVPLLPSHSAEAPKPTLTSVP